MSLVDVDAPWDLAVSFVVMAIVLLGGTLWLVPSSRVRQVRRNTGTVDPRR